MPSAGPASSTDDRLTRRYGAEPIEQVRHFQPLTFDRRLEVRDALDPGYTKAWLSYSAGLFTRPHLDVGLRALILAAQFTMTRHPNRLRDVLVLAIRENLDLQQVLEAILQCGVYGGEVLLDAALDVFLSVVDEFDLRSAIQERQLPPDGRDADRDFEAEEAAWHPDDATDPRLPWILETYGRLAVSNALLARPKWAIDLIERYDQIDPGFTQLWLDATYHRMYTRNILDLKTRLLCMTGGLLSVGEAVQSRRHMRGALRAGAQPEQILEIAFMGCALFGHPHMLGGAVVDFMKILKEHNQASATEAPKHHVV